MTEDSNKSVREYVEKLADDKLAEVLGGRTEPTRRVWTEDRKGGRWVDDELEWESYRPRVEVKQKSLFAEDVPAFLDRRKPKQQQFGVSIEGPEEWAGVVRPQGGVAVLSDFMVTKVTDILMREMCDVLERAQLIFVSEAASQNVRQGFRKIVGEYVQFLDKRTGEYSDVEVE